MPRKTALPFISLSCWISSGIDGGVCRHQGNPGARVRSARGGWQTGFARGARSSWVFHCLWYDAEVGTNEGLSLHQAWFRHSPVCRTAGVLAFGSLENAFLSPKPSRNARRRWRRRGDEPGSRCCLSSFQMFSISMPLLHQFYRTSEFGLCFLLSECLVECNGDLATPQIPRSVALKSVS